MINFEKQDFMSLLQHFTQTTLPFFQKQVVYVIGAAELELDIRQEIDSLATALQDFDAVLHDILKDSKDFSQSETENLYNTIYALLALFKKVAKKLAEKDTSQYALFMVNFGNIIATLQTVRKQLLLQLEGELITAISTQSKKNLLNKID
jgi:uncharacterized membrane protein